MPRSSRLFIARLFDRTPDNPVEIHVFGQTTTELPVHTVLRWIDADRTHVEVMGARGLALAGRGMRCGSTRNCSAG
jgi:hypothetical protein